MNHIRDVPPESTAIARALRLRENQATFDRALRGWRAKPCGVLSVRSCNAIAMPLRSAVRSCCCAALVMFLVHTSTLRAQGSPDSSRGAPVYEQLVERALAAFDRGEYAQARSLFERAHALRPNARTLRGLGFSAVELKDYAAARRELTAALTEPKQALTPEQREEVTSLLAWMSRELASLSIDLSPPQAQLRLNGQPSEAELVLEPGAYELSAEAPDQAPRALRVVLDRGERRRLELHLERRVLQPTAAAIPPPRAATPAPSEALHPADPAAPHEPNLFGRWWFWAISGAVVAAGATTALVLLTRPSAERYREGGVGGVVSVLRVAR